jgi:SNF2 family DNA or RNA helicase
MRLIDMVYGLDVDSKVYRCAENIMNIYENTRDKKLIQMVFCDSSTPKQGFNLYDELKNILIAMGMPANEIAFIHDADSEDKKNLLFYDLRKGDVSVVIGSTFKMGLGVNVQEKLCALHHLDVPWRPADMVQREGRILRQGNLCDSVKIYRYITKGSFDAYSWQLLEKKQRFISQILSGNVCEREGDDVDETVLNYAEVKALSVGNPLIKKKVEITNEIDKLRILQRDYIVSRQRKEQELSELPAKIEKQKKHIADTEEDIKYYAENKIDYKEMEYEDQKEIRDLIYTAVKTHVNKPMEKVVLTYQGFDVVVPARMIPKTPSAKSTEDGEVKSKEPIPYVFVKRNGAYYMEVESLQGITKRLNNLLEDLPKAKIRREGVLETLENKKAVLEAELAKKGESYAAEISKLALELEKIDKKLGVAA